MEKILGEGSYPGRMLGVGRTKSGKPLAVYALTGRSDMSKQRRAVIVGNSVQITPLGELTPEQEKSKDLIIYRAMSIHVPSRTLVLSNGKQTDPIFNLTCHYGLSIHDALYATMYTMGFEPDSLKTPRIAGLILTSPYVKRIVSIVVEDTTQPEGKMADIATLDAGGLGMVDLVSTYTGDYDNPKAPDLSRHSYWIHSATVDGDSASEIAQELYDSLNEKVRVSAIAAVLEHDGWMINVCNLYV